jgi:hypothetical protein
MPLFEEKDWGNYAKVEKRWDAPKPKGFIAKIDASVLGKILVKIAEKLGERKKR